jgi:hypothetical protein
MAIIVVPIDWSVGMDPIYPEQMCFATLQYIPRMLVSSLGASLSVGWARYVRFSTAAA